MKVVVVVMAVSLLNFIAGSRCENQTIEEKDAAEASLSDAHEIDGGDDLPDKAKRRVVEGLALNLQGRGPEVVVHGYLNLPDDLQASTLCFWVKPYKVEFYVNLMTNTRVQFFIDMYNLVVTKTSYMVRVIPKIEIRVWVHICVAIHDQGFDTYMNGRLTEQMRDQPASFDDHMKVVLAGNIPMVISSNSTLYYFSGMLADLRLFPKKLTQAEADDVRTGEWRGVNYKMTINKTLTTHSKLNIVRNITYEELFHRPPDYTILSFYEPLTYPQTVRACQTYGGFLPNTDTEDITTIFRKCATNIGHSTDIWLHQPNYDPHNPKQKCSMITHYLQGNATVMPWKCDGISSTLCCYVPRQTRVRMIGGDYLEEDIFFFEQPSIAGQGVILEGEKTLHVGWENSSSVTVMTKKGEVLFRQQPATNHYMGRSLWSATQGGNFNISFSVCKKGQFSCSNGECVSLSKRCDGVPADCSDNSDEDDTCGIFHGPPRHYYPKRGPSDPRINVTLHVIYVRNVDTDRNRLEVMMGINLAWRDERLTFHNLRSSDGLPNILDNDVLSSLWVPSLYFPYALFEENLNLEKGAMTHTTVAAVPVGSGSPTTINSYEALEFPGSGVVLEMQVITLVTTTCSFTLKAFPFDTQMCVIPLQLRGFGTPQVAEEHLRVLSNDLSLPVFGFHPVRCFYNASMPQQVEMGLLLERRNGAFLFSSIGPCVVLLLLGHLSFVAFPLHQFTDRASTSLSLLIVVAALFSQMSSTLPESAQPKAIDMWFFYCILRLFIFFVFHCIVDYHYKRSIEADRKQKEFLASSKHQEALIPFKAPSYDSLKKPPLPDKENNEAPRHHGRWVTEGKRSLPSITLPRAWLTSQLVNRMSLLFGLFQDLMFVIGFCVHLETTNRFTKTQFNIFKDCSGKG
ncbi:hypothetical protein O3P69_015180 [Scylla paramamosain]|uniref:Neurotransmitter-gated ion-channel ligand-binding domain-containing protein n=1 Tax=Scylla paramamosain TaxID=85552 RepID=A0AAW0T354_SCYPA